MGQKRPKFAQEDCKHRHCMFSFNDNSNDGASARRPYRYAIYFTPQLTSSWAQAGNHWLGRCVSSSKSLEQPFIDGVAPSVFAALTEDPRRYGWHATLKAPFRLAHDQNVKQLTSGIQQLAETMSAFSLPPLRVGLLRDYLALRPEGDLKRINAIARACTTALHSFAAPLAPHELKQRRSLGLSEEQDRMLSQWGYPWVLDQFQFHFSLSGALKSATPEVRLALLYAAQRHFHHLENCRFEQISLFIEPAAGESFQVLENFPLKP
jgi:Protein of unknown function (DUF1045)